MGYAQLDTDDRIGWRNTVTKKKMDGKKKEKLTAGVLKTTKEAEGATSFLDFGFICRYLQ